MKQLLVFLLSLVLTSCTTSIYEVTVVDSGKNDTMTLKVESRERLSRKGDDTKFFIVSKNNRLIENNIMYYAKVRSELMGDTEVVYTSSNPINFISIKYCGDE